jgi:uncharacterized protein
VKYLLVLGIALLVVWIWKSNRREEMRDSARKAPSRDKQKLVVTEIVACDVCHVHLPRSEALTGPGGVYCSTAHRKQATGK